MGTPQDRTHADLIQSAIMTAGGAARSALVASWRRSSELHGLDPAELGSVRTLPMVNSGPLINVSNVLSA